MSYFEKVTGIVNKKSADLAIRKVVVEGRVYLVNLPVIAFTLQPDAYGEWLGKISSYIY
ncbi:hypothetical protein APE01nite_23150 [Acetobacter peroxydans]|uniref:Uncharacterized protein n=1 Tax=Acetobacter peroxydans TaxID=104098 RepID=A0A4Y3TXQ3_9PROT|nr:hypothetical protein APE01nite_23150 [Acetobacter peroxydans]